LQIIHRIEDFLFELFPNIKNAPDTNSALKEELIRYYTIDDSIPTVEIENGWVIITITNPAQQQDADFKRAVSLCEKKMFSQAKDILNKLMQKDKTNSEYFRICGQILSEEGNQDDAIDCLIDALRWDPKNVWALIMMGNIFARHKDNITTAMKYFDQVLSIDPKNNIALNNIGANLMRQNKIEAAKKYFKKAIEINPDYPNTYYAMGMVADIESDLHNAFDFAILAIKKNNNKDTLYQNSVQLAFDLAKKIIQSNKIDTPSSFSKSLEKLSNKSIEFIEDPSIPTAAKIEIAEYHKHHSHIIKYKPDYPAIEHLQMHELMHLKLVLEARTANHNYLYITNQEHRKKFQKKIEYMIPKLKKMGATQDSIDNFFTSIFDGINSQIYNTPIDLIIEESLYKEYPYLRPFQFLSIFNILQNGIEAVTNANIVKSAPTNVISISKSFNLISALHFKTLYGIDLISKFKATNSEIDKAKRLYAKYQSNRNRTAGQEYALVLDFADELDVGDIFELIEENAFKQNSSDIDDIAESIENDPFGVNTNDLYKAKEQDTFDKRQAEIGFNPAVQMYMVDALEFFKNMSNDKIKEIALEIAIIGTKGISPDRKDYSVRLIPGKIFTGYHLLSYYYVSWKLAIPEMVDKLGLPFSEEYKAASQLFKDRLDG
jgi:Tfp pilus assembly protein PilF